MSLIRRTNTQRGAALVEYGMVVRLIAVLSIGSVLALGEEIDGLFSDTTDVLSSTHASYASTAAAEPVETGPNCE